MPDRPLQPPVEVNEDPIWETRETAAERVAWVVFALIILAGGLGLLGSPGVLNGATAGSEHSQLEIAYDRFLHFDAQTVIQVRFKSVPGSDGKTRVWLSRAHMQQFVLDQVMPPADSSEVTPDRMIFVFQSPPEDRQSAVLFAIRPQTPGSLSGEIGLVGGYSLAFSQFVYP